MVAAMVSIPRKGAHQHKEGVRPSLSHQTGTMKLPCPFCHSGPTLVVDSRKPADGSYARRTRACRACGKRWTTVEITHAELLEFATLRAMAADVRAAFKKMDEPKDG